MVPLTADPLLRAVTVGDRGCDWSVESGRRLDSTGTQLMVPSAGLSLPAAEASVSHVIEVATGTCCHCASADIDVPFSSMVSGER